MELVYYRPGRFQTVVINQTTSTAFAPVDAYRCKLRVVANADCWIFLTNPATTAAVGTGLFLQAGVVQMFHCAMADILSAITDQPVANGATAQINVVEMVR